MSIKEIYEKFVQSSGVITDSRKAKKNCIFFSLKGPNFNGNKFAKNAVDNGALIALVDEEKYALDNANYIYVKDCLETLQKLANFHRKKLKTKIIALTGSNGKTTTKELINSVLKTKFKTSYTEGNLNNHIGVPLSLLKITEETELAIIEMGANHTKEIESLCKITEPDFGYITNFGKAHLEGFGSEQGVVQGKSELYEFLIKKNGLIFYNSDDEKQIKILCKYDNKFGFGKTNSDVKYQTKSVNPKIIINVNQTDIKSSLFGNYNVENIVAAITIGLYFKLRITDIKNGILNYISSNNRSQIINKEKNNIILDAYNANPTSMILAINNFEKLDVENKIFILGDMFELGKDEIKFHQEIIDYCKNIKAKKIFIIGHIFSKTKFSKNFISFDNYNELINMKEFKNITDSNFFIKGSRGIKLERIVDYIS